MEEMEMIKSYGDARDVSGSATVTGGTDTQYGEAGDDQLYGDVGDVLGSATVTGGR